jgi:hypothetical protein
LGFVDPGWGGGKIERDRTKREPAAGISKNQALKWFGERTIIPSFHADKREKPL